MVWAWLPGLACAGVPVLLPLHRLHRLLHNPASPLLPLYRLRCITLLPLLRGPAKQVQQGAE